MDTEVADAGPVDTPPPTPPRANAQPASSSQHSSAQGSPVSVKHAVADRLNEDGSIVQLTEKPPPAEVGTVFLPPDSDDEGSAGSPTKKPNRSSVGASAPSDAATSDDNTTGVVRPLTAVDTPVSPRADAPATASGANASESSPSSKEGDGDDADSDDGYGSDEFEPTDDTHTHADAEDSKANAKANAGADVAVTGDSASNESRAPSPVAADEQERAATALQAAARGRQARKQVAALREEQGEQEKAATALQAAARGRQARKEVAAMKAEQVDSGNAEVTGEDSEQQKAATALQAVARGRQARKEVATLREEQAEQEKAATALQAAARGRQARKEVAAMKAEQVDSGDIKATDEDSEQQKAATALQAAARGRQARKQVAALREEQAEQEKAATALQAAARGRQARKEVAAMKAEQVDSADVADGGSDHEDEYEDDFVDDADDSLAQQNAAATALQAAARGRQARKQVAAMGEADHLGQSVDHEAYIESAATPNSKPGASSGAAVDSGDEADEYGDDDFEDDGGSTDAGVTEGKAAAQGDGDGAADEAKQPPVTPRKPEKGRVSLDITIDDDEEEKKGSTSRRSSRSGSVSSYGSSPRSPQPNLADPSHTNLLRKWSTSSVKVQAATSVQAAVRGRLTRKKLKSGELHKELVAKKRQRHEAATSVQKVERGRQGRRRAAKLRAQRKREEEERRKAQRAEALRKRRLRKKRLEELANRPKYVYGPDGRKRTEEEDARIRAEEAKKREEEQQAKLREERRKARREQKAREARRARMEELQRQRDEERTNAAGLPASPIRLPSGVPLLPNLTPRTELAQFQRSTAMGSAADLHATTGGSQTARSGANHQGSFLPSMPLSARSTTDHRRNRRKNPRGRRYKQSKNLGRPTVFSVDELSDSAKQRFTTRQALQGGNGKLLGGYVIGGDLSALPRLDSPSQAREFTTSIDAGENVVMSASRRQLPRRPSEAQREISRVKPRVDSHWNSRPYLSTMHRLNKWSKGNPRDHSDYMQRYLQKRHVQRLRRQRARQQTKAEKQEQLKAAYGFGSPPRGGGHTDSAVSIGLASPLVGAGMGDGEGGGSASGGGADTLPSKRLRQRGRHYRPRGGPKSMAARRHRRRMAARRRRAAADEADSDAETPEVTEGILQV